MNFGHAIRKIRNEKGTRQNFVAEKAGISNEYLSNIESGAKKPTMKVLEKIAAALGVSAAYLLVSAVEDNIDSDVSTEKVDDLKNILNSIKPLI